MTARFTKEQKKKIKVIAKKKKISENEVIRIAIDQLK